MEVEDRRRGRGKRERREEGECKDMSDWWRRERLGGGGGGVRGGSMAGKQEGGGEEVSLVHSTCSAPKQIAAIEDGRN